MPNILDILSAESIKQNAQNKMQDINAIASGLDKQNPPGMMDSAIAQMLLQMAPGSGDILAAKDSSQMANQAYQNFRQGNYGQAGQDLLWSLVAGAGALPMIPHISQAMVAFHGSPHKFNPTPRNPLGEFDLSKIGTGEGAQAYGHGIYVA